MGMKVFDLRCAQGHRFEGWFASEDDFRSQCDRHLLTCPMCDDAQIERIPSAARLNVSHLAERSRSAPAGLVKAGQTAPSADSPGPAAGQDGSGRAIQATGVDLQAMWLRAVHHVMANTEDVGDAFAAEAREIHHGRSEQRGIRGQATPAEAAELREEGIEVHSIPIPTAMRGPIQ